MSGTTIPSSAWWTNQRVIQLIELYKSYRCLWDFTCLEYKNKTAKQNAWDAIAQRMEAPNGKTDVESKMHTLRSQFSRERKKLKQTASTESDNPVKITWFAYEPLLFLAKTETRRRDKEAIPNDESSYTEEDPLIIEVDMPQQNDEKLAEVAPRKRCLEPNHSDERENDNKMPKLQNIIVHHNGPDEYEIFGKFVASELRHCQDQYSMLMAKKLIHDVLFNARIGKYQRRNTIDKVKQESSENYSNSLELNDEESE